jgi:hypothetical protein
MLTENTYRHSRRVVTATGTTSATATITAPANGDVIVLDWIIASGVADATPAAFVITVNGLALMTWRAEAASIATMREMGFGGTGYPSWSASDTDSVPKGTNTPIALTGVASGATLVVGYHTIPQAVIRAGN